MNGKEEHKVQLSTGEIDSKPTTSNSLAILNLLMKKSGHSVDKQDFKRSKNIDNIFGRFKRLSGQSNLL